MVFSGVFVQMRNFHRVDGGASMVKWTKKLLWCIITIFVLVKCL